MSTVSRSELPAEEGPASDSDETSEGSDYYQLISAEDDPLQEEDRCVITNGHSQYPSEYHSPHRFPPHSSPNGFAAIQMTSGFSNLNVDNVEGGGEEHAEDEDDIEEEEHLREDASESAISAAFSEDERRRSTPLTPERSSAIINAMQGISFPGFRPDWTDRVLDAQWVDQLRRLREPTTQNCNQRNV